MSSDTIDVNLIAGYSSSGKFCFDCAVSLPCDRTSFVPVFTIVVEYTINVYHAT